MKMVMDQVDQEVGVKVGMDLASQVVRLKLGIVGLNQTLNQLVNLTHQRDRSVRVKKVNQRARWRVARNGSG